MADISVVKEWLQKADEDLEFAKFGTSANKKSFYDHACFLFQQAAEKYLKACIVAYDLPFKKIHDLGVLLEMLTEKYPAFGVLKHSCDLLTSFYVETRYPSSGEFQISEETARQAHEAAEAVRDFVKKFLKI